MGRTRFSIAGLMGFVLIVAVGVAGLKAATPLWASACLTLAFVSLVAAVLLAIQARGRKRAYWLGFSVAGWLYLYFAFYNVATDVPPPQILTALILEKVEEIFFPNANTGALTVNFTTSPPTVPVPMGTTFTFAGSPPTPVPAPSAPPKPVVPSQVSGEDADASAGYTQGDIIVTSPNTAISTVAPIAVPPPIAPLPFAVTGPTPIQPFWVQNPTNFQQVGHGIATLLFAYAGGLFSLFLAGRRERDEANPAAVSTPDVSPSSP